ncbi:uncharacterized protein LOC120446431 isoform X2 [Drosophila santomea]|uniref:uncharacterized protein LOC120446431 isoform X2 n=1 Tax=Drosophila santomea TaxID=129105 RepID=UPI00195402C4|nr:uncharacterized protein LOC120446431 isoform X2 [Drosophila santomea]
MKAMRSKEFGPRSCRSCGRKSGDQGVLLPRAYHQRHWLHKENNRRRESDSESFNVAKCGPSVPFADPIARAAPLWTGGDANANARQKDYCASLLERK